MDWKTMLSYISGSVDEELLLRNEYLVAENRVVPSIYSSASLCIVKTAPPTKSRTYAPLEFRAEDGETPPLCSTLLSSSSHLASVSFGRCVGAAPTWCWRTSLCGSK